MIAPKGGGDRWDVKGLDVPGGRFNRSVMQGLAMLPSDELRLKEKARRHMALDRFRAAARDLEGEDRDAVWSLIPYIGRNGYPSWAEVVQARTRSEILTLAQRGELHIEQEARRDRGAQNSERRLTVHGVDEYLHWQVKEEFAPDTTATAASLLRRMLRVTDSMGVAYADRRVASLLRSDGDHVLDALGESSRSGRTVGRKTRAKNRKILQAWMSYELMKEADRAEEQMRPPAFHTNIFAEKTARYSKPSKDARRTLADVDTRRFFPDEMDRIIEFATGMWPSLLVVSRRLGLRPGEVTHIRWMDDVIPLPDEAGYEILLEGGRGPDERCKCRQCVDQKGWSPKNKPRRYVLDRRNDTLGWIREVCETFDAWIGIRVPQRGDFVFPDPDDWAVAMTNQKLNRGLHEIAERAGVVTGSNQRGGRTAHSLRHTCASELLEAGISHPHAAYWIGDSLDEFMATYGRPTDAAMARAIFSGSSGKPTLPDRGR
jgi:integrase